ncbi:TetR family transcriptional regulator [Williamsia limnetica]|uniref:TetR family transcriptional regulator n=1 Tax=Williamsia limnetica TaxID=882452 RepID=A0A318RMG3_WILLI|nr:helix-turn-helix domain-containing protein [Williamsia limnetica]PYE16916.1 TetR family transcriptional regulator [Williamsia limnetica]
MIDAAEQVFSEHGLDAAVDEMARVAGVVTRKLYRRFPTEDALISELVPHILSELFGTGHFGLSAPGGDGLAEVLFATGARQASHRGCISRLWNDDKTRLPKDEYRRMVHRLLADASAHRRIREDVTLTDIDSQWAKRANGGNNSRHHRQQLAAGSWPP